jgi:ssDNA-binding Zn-finger/Zn-ribbon topoisomerase 1
METENFIEEIIAFMKAQDEAEKSHKEGFKCPLCGGDAWWKRSSYNNHLHCACRKCGLHMME